MTTGIASGTRSGVLLDSLLPAGAALLDDARSEARRILAEANHAAEERIAQAEREAEVELDRARRRQEQAAQARVDQELARARTEAHDRVLSTRSELRDRLVDDVHAAALAMRHDTRYPDLLDRLEAIVRAQLGTGAVIERDPDPAGGVRATSGRRQVDYTLPALADRALDVLADQVATLWT